MEESKRCMACMEEYTGSVCSRCGFDNTETSQTPFLKMGTLLQERYLVGKVRSSNSEGVSYTAYDKTNQSRIILREFFPQMVCFRAEDGKTVGTLAGGEEVFARTKAEFLALSRKVAHYRDRSSVMPVFDIFTENNVAYVVYEWCPGGTLKEYIERKEAPMSWNMARTLFLPLQFALEEMHGADFGHYGISPENLYLYPEGKMKLSGFCIEEIRREEQDLPPELFSGCAALEQYTANRSLGEYTDVYGFSACLFYALTATMPQEALRRKYDNRLLIPNAILQEIPSYVVSALSGGLQVSVEDRVKTFEDLHRLFVGAQIEEETEKTEQTEQTEAPEKAAAAPLSPKEKREKKAKRILRLPDFLVGGGTFLLTFLLLWAFGWDYLGVSRDLSWLFAANKKTASSAVSGQSSAQSAATSSEGTSSGENTSSEAVSSIPEGAIEVPEFKNVKLSEAQNNTSFTVLLQAREFSDEVAEGCVISQSLSGYAQPGSVITVVVSKGSSKRVLPNVVGQTLERATAMLTEQGFSVGTVAKEASESASGTVLRFTDAAAVSGKTYEAGTSFNLVVAQ